MLRELTYNSVGRLDNVTYLAIGPSPITRPGPPPHSLYARTVQKFIGLSVQSRADADRDTALCI